MNFFPKSICILGYEIVIDRNAIKLQYHWLVLLAFLTSHEIEKKKEFFSYSKVFLLAYPSHILYTDLLCSEDVSLNQG